MYDMRAMRAQKAYRCVQVLRQPSNVCSLREIRPFDMITDGHAGAPFPMLMSSSLLLGKNNSLMSL